MDLYKQKCPGDWMYFVSSDFEVILAYEINSSMLIHFAVQADTAHLHALRFFISLLPNPTTRI